MSTGGERHLRYGLWKNSEILGLEQGSKVPQIVIAESIRMRAGGTGYIVPEEYSIASLLPRRSRSEHRTVVFTRGSETASMFSEATLILTNEWGEYPKLD